MNKSAPTLRSLDSGFAAKKFDHEKLCSCNITTVQASTQLGSLYMETQKYCDEDSGFERRIILLDHAQHAAFVTMSEVVCTNGPDLVDWDKDIEKWDE